MPPLFNNWPDPYESWFQTSIGALVKRVELELALKLLQPQAGEHILDAGCEGCHAQQRVSVLA